MKLDSIAHLARRTLRKTGFDLLRFRSLNTVLAHHGINLVLDVGANVGQYGHELRELGYRGRIVSFEPQQQPFGVLAEAARQDGQWEAVHIGLGDVEEQREINVYDDSRLSSFLTMGGETAHFNATQVARETIQVRTVDGILGQYLRPDDKVLLKIDTQGFERQVLAGAEQSLGRLAGIQIEMSVAPLYDDQPRMEDMITLLRSKNFLLWQMMRGAADMATGRELEVDGVFIRRDLAQT